MVFYDILTIAQLLPFLFFPAYSPHQSALEIMGANLSSTEVPDLSQVTLSSGDKLADLYLLLFTSGSFYAIGMIFGTTQLVDHWRGPYGDRSVSAMGVIAALILSTAWPIILFYVWFLV